MLFRCGVKVRARVCERFMVLVSERMKVRVRVETRGYVKGIRVGLL